jgi:hypothetical protein
MGAAGTSGAPSLAACVLPFPRGCAGRVRAFAMGALHPPLERPPSHNGAQDILSFVNTMATDSEDQLRT